MPAEREEGSIQLVDLLIKVRSCSLKILIKNTFIKVAGVKRVSTNRSNLLGLPFRLEFPGFSNNTLTYYILQKRFYKICSLVKNVSSIKGFENGVIV